jgi:hypothetical protein
MPQARERTPYTIILPALLESGRTDNDTGLISLSRTGVRPLTANRQNSSLLPF